MRVLKRNKRTIYYATLTSVVPRTDAYGNETGDMTYTFSTPTAIKVNYMLDGKVANEDVERSGAGIAEKHTYTIVTDDMDCPITYTTRLWIGIATTEAHNFCVTAMNKSLNSIAYTIKEI